MGNTAFLRIQNMLNKSVPVTPKQFKAFYPTKTLTYMVFLCVLLHMNSYISVKNAVKKEAYSSGKNCEEMLVYRSGFGDGKTLQREFKT